jgi:hypothetical protein
LHFVLGFLVDRQVGDKAQDQRGVGAVAGRICRDMKFSAINKKHNAQRYAGRAEKAQGGHPTAARAHCIGRSQWLAWVATQAQHANRRH